MTYLAADTPASGGGLGMIGSLWPILIMFAVLYFLLIRPQQKRSKNRNSMLGSLKKGDKVITIGGLHGTIQEITDDTIVLRVNDATKLTFERSAINAKSAQSPAPAAAPATPASPTEEQS